MFARFKLFDLPGFADGFQMYHLTGRRVRGFALAQPLVELALALAHLTGAFPVDTNIAVVAIMLLGAAGILTSLRKGLDIDCAREGTTSRVPLSAITVIEEVGMAFVTADRLQGLKSSKPTRPFRRQGMPRISL